MNDMDHMDSMESSDSKERKYAPLPPYDSSMDYNYSMYDNMAYKRDYDLTGENTIRKISGNVLKSYTYQIQPDTYSLDNKDSVFLELLAKKKKEEQRRKELATTAKTHQPEVEETENPLTKEQWEGLMMDTDETKAE